jgi:hypothetical protein
VHKTGKQGILEKISVKTKKEDFQGEEKLIFGNVNILELFKFLAFGKKQRGPFIPREEC